jgi:ribosomal peptide maturation radical SAM protein 1
LKARSRTGAFLRDACDEILGRRPSVVGFTSVFQQHAASLATARLIKAAAPHVFIVFGGANCEGVMGAETLRQFPFVDAVVSGEADHVLAELVRRRLDGREIASLPGVRSRSATRLEMASDCVSNGPLVSDLDALPYPDYRDYFRRFARSPLAERWTPGVCIETSRGCWWGERHHCTFCGLNGSTMTYRSKSAPRALAELTFLARRHEGCDVVAVDNILDLQYFKDFVPRLAARRVKLGLFYETKSNLKREQIAALHEAGVRRIQPGIESLSDEILRLMRKGVSGLQNIQLLKWCRELGVEPIWNFLWGFPGESATEYARMAQQIPLLAHLRPPVSFGALRLDRFSPNFNEAHTLGFRDLTPFSAYRHVYRGLPDRAIANLAYYFDFSYQHPHPVDEYTQPLRRALSWWQRVAARSALFSHDTNARLFIWDLRPRARRPLTIVAGVDRALLQACDRIADLCGLTAIALAIDSRLDGPAVAARLEALVADGLLLREETRYLALAIPLGEYQPPAAAMRRFYEVAHRLGVRRPSGLIVPLNPPAGQRARRKQVSVSARRRSPRSLRPPRFALNRQGDLVIR